MFNTPYNAYRDIGTINRWKIPAGLRIFFMFYCVCVTTVYTTSFLLYLCLVNVGSSSRQTFLMYVFMMVVVFCRLKICFQTDRER